VLFSLLLVVQVVVYFLSVPEQMV
jgi:hypothetical protein